MDTRKAYPYGVVAYGASVWVGCPGMVQGWTSMYSPMSLYKQFNSYYINLVETHGLQPHLYRLCQWHAHCWLLSSVRHCTASEPRVCVYWWRRAMDAGQPAASQHGNDGRSVVCVVSSAASYTGWIIESGLGPCPVRSKSGYQDGYPSWHKSIYPWNLTTWRRCCTTFTGFKSRNESRLGWRFWRTAVRIDLYYSRPTMLMTFTS